MSPTIVRDEPARESGEVAAGLLPPRYGQPMQKALLEVLEPALVGNAAILDVGAGRAPTLAPADRPPGAHYVGLDVSREELDAADPQAYDATIVQDVSLPLATDRQFDVVISWQVLEHVDHVDRALESLRGALRPGGLLVAQLSGARAVFAVLARAMPHRIRVKAMKHLLGHSEEEKFPVRYDRCIASRLTELLASWSSAEVIPHYRGATYFGFSRPLQRAYLSYENWIASRDAADLATHYLIVARR